MKSVLSFYVNLLLKLSLSQSILITIVTSLTQCLWGGVPCTFPQAEDFWQKPDQSFDVLMSSKWRLSSWTFSFCGRHCFSEVSHPQQYSIATRDTLVPMNIEVLTKYPLSHYDRIVVLEICIHSESPMLYRPALHGNWNALSLTRRALKDKFLTPMIPLTAVLPNCQVFLPDPVYLQYAHLHPTDIKLLHNQTNIQCVYGITSFNLA